MQTTANETTVNGIDVEGLRGAAAAIAADPREGAVSFDVATTWKGGTRSETHVRGYGIGGRAVAREFRFASDEPHELFGGNTAPNPQEYLMGALCACMTVGYVAGAALRGIRLDGLEIRCSGALDLRGFLGIDPEVAPGYETLRVSVRIRGDATPEQFEEIHAAVRATSPNFFNLSRPIAIEDELIVG